MNPAARVALALIVLSGILLADPPATAHHFDPIQPGARFWSGAPNVAWCTLNFVFTDAAGEVYIGTAGHCFRGLAMGARSSAPGIGEFGAVVYAEEYSDPLRWMDFGLIRVDEDKRHLVDPAVRVYGGPTGVQSEFLPGTPTLLYGHPNYLSATEASRALRPGVLEYVKEDPNWVPNPGWFFVTNPTYAGNSGGPVITADGKALGIVALLGVLDKAATGGPTVETILAWMAEDGWDLELVTAPYSLPAVLVSVTVGQVEHCANAPMGTQASPDACVVPPV